MIKTYTPSMLVQAANDANMSAEDSIKATQGMEVFKEMAKDVLAKIMCEIKSTKEGKVSEAELERLARASSDWEEFRGDYYAAIKAGIEAKVKAQNARLYFEAVQSALSYQKEEFKRLGGEP